MAYKGESVRAPGSRGMSHRTLRMQEYRVQETDSNCCSGLRDLLLDTKDPRCIFASSSQGQGYMWDTRLSGEKETAQLFSPLKIASAVSSPLVISDDGHTVIGGDGERGELLIWDMRKLGGKSMSFGTLGDKAQRVLRAARSAFAENSRRKTLRYRMSAYTGSGTTQRIKDVWVSISRTVGVVS